MSFGKLHPEYGAGAAKIPLLEEVLAYVHDETRMVINIELKTGVFFYPGIEAAAVHLVHKFGMEDRVIYSSFNHYSIRRVQQIDSKAYRCAAVCGGPPCQCSSSVGLLPAVSGVHGGLQKTRAGRKRLDNQSGGGHEGLHEGRRACCHHELSGSCHQSARGADGRRSCMTQDVMELQERCEHKDVNT